MGKKIVFIGTFNPVTVGHLLMAQTTLNKCDIQGKEKNEVLFVPVSDYYQKDELNTKAIYRVEMLKQATLDNDAFIVDMVEIEFAKEMKRQPKTIETLTMLRNKYPNDEICLLIGTDNFYDLHTWYEYDEMVKMFTMVVYPRLGFDSQAKEEQQVYIKYPSQFIFVDTELTTNISSSEIRNNFKLGKSNKYLLPDRVLSYIINHYYYLDYCIGKGGLFNEK